MSDSIEAKLKQIIAAQIDVPIDEIHADSKFHANLGLDSLDVVNLISAINMEFKIRLMEKDIIEIDTVSQLVSSIELHLSQRC